MWNEGIWIEVGRWVDIPVVLIREVQEATWDAAFLEDIEQGQTLRYGETVVQIAVDDELRGVELKDTFGGRRIPATVVVTVVPEGSVEL
jgi:hypothetical protein